MAALRRVVKVFHAREDAQPRRLNVFACMTYNSARLTQSRKTKSKRASCWQQTMYTWLTSNAHSEIHVLHKKICKLLTLVATLLLLSHRQFPSMSALPVIGIPQALDSSPTNWEREDWTIVRWVSITLLMMCCHNSNPRFYPTADKRLMLKWLFWRHMLLFIPGVFNSQHRCWCPTAFYALQHVILSKSQEG